jgi:hypothetical protein
MRLVLLSEDSDGTSHFSDVNIPMSMSSFAPPAPEMPISSAEPCKRILFMVLPAGWAGAKHKSPRRQIAFCLSGRLSTIAGDGEIRELGPGDILRMEDTTRNWPHDQRAQ